MSRNRLKLHCCVPDTVLDDLSVSAWYKCLKCGSVFNDCFSVSTVIIYGSELELVERVEEGVCFVL